jgi:hypothetical protein
MDMKIKRIGLLQMALASAVNGRARNAARVQRRMVLCMTLPAQPRNGP